MIIVDDLRAFQKVATLLSFSAAARLMGVPKSAVSRSIRRLEVALHIRLFERSTRDVALTDAGRAMLEELSHAIARVDNALDLAATLSAHPRGRLRLTAGIGFGIEVLTDVLPAFSRAYPDVAVSLDLTSRTVDLIAEHVDIAIRMGPLADSDLIVTRLGGIGCQLCASSDYLERRGRPRTIDDLGEHDLIALPRADGRPRRWTLIDGDGSERSVATSSRLSVNDPHAIGRMAINGAGIASIANFVAVQDIGAGRLERVLPDWSIPAVDVSIVMPRGRERSPAARAFVGFMRDHMAGSQWMDA